MGLSRGAALSDLVLNGSFWHACAGKPVGRPERR